METTDTYLRKALISWEIMRVIFSTVGGAIFAVWCMDSHVSVMESLVITALNVALVNILLCIGPVAECLLYVYFKFRLGNIRYLMAPACLLALVLAMKYFWPTHILIVFTKLSMLGLVH